MSDYEAISETVFHYCEGYRNKDRERLEKAFSLEVASMMGYIKNKDGDLELFSMSMRDAIDSWVAPVTLPLSFLMGIFLPLISSVMLVLRFFLISVANTWRVISWQK
jgi:hypothetical protein